MKKITNIWYITVLLIIAILLSGCSEKESEFTNIINKSIDAHSKVKSYWINAKVQHRYQDEDQQIEMTIEYVSPDKIHINTVVIGERISREEQIQVGTIRYTREKPTDMWHSRNLDGEGAMVRDIAKDAIDSINELVDVVKLDDEVINGVVCFHYKGSKNMQSFQDEQLGENNFNNDQSTDLNASIEHIKNDMECWIGKEDYLIRKYSTYLEESIYIEVDKETAYYEATSIFELHGYNENYEINVPLTESD